MATGQGGLDYSQQDPGQDGQEADDDPRPALYITTSPPLLLSSLLSFLPSLQKQ